MHQLPLVPERAPSNPGSGVSARDTPEPLFLAPDSPRRLMGSVERVAYFDAESGQCVLDVKAGNLKNHILISGRVANVFPGQSLEAELLPGTSGGLYHATEIRLHAPNSERTLKKFLKSGALSNIGPRLATFLAKAFPENLLAILEQEPGRLLQIAGVGQKRQSQILSAWLDFRGKRDFEFFLFGQGLPLHWAKTLWPAHGPRSQSHFIANPYSVAREYEFSFDLVDSYAQRQGFSPESNDRLCLALVDLLRAHYKEGHCAYPDSELLNEAQHKLSVSFDLLEKALELELASESIVSDTIGETPCLYLAEIWRLEKEVAQKLLAFELKEPPWGWFNMHKVLSWAQSLLNIQLALLQKQAIETAVSSPLTVITGGPGTGKTTLIRSLVAILQTQHLRFALCSPTGRAAQRLEEATRVPAHTIHRLLKFNSTTGGFAYNRQHPLPLDLVLIDEASMVDLSLMYHLLEALPEHCALILVGDADQIPPVGAGQILQSVIASGRFTTVRLTDIFRQSDQSLIKLNASRINSGEMPLTEWEGKADFHFFPVHGIDETKGVILDLVTRVIPEKFGIKDPRQIQILVPMNRGSLGTHQLNEELQSSLVAESANSLKASIHHDGLNGFGQSFRVGDKVMVIKNDYSKDVFNGDVGFIQSINRFDQMIDVELENRIVSFGFDELDRLTLAYAISIHKSQGSEYRAVIVVIGPEHLPMTRRHLIYTAVTRGKEHVFLVADPDALQAAVSSDEHNRRWQKLTERLSVI